MPVTASWSVPSKQEIVPPSVPPGGLAVALRYQLGAVVVAAVVVAEEAVVDGVQFDRRAGRKAVDDVHRPGRCGEWAVGGVGDRAGAVVLLLADRIGLPFALLPVDRVSCAPC